MVGITCKAVVKVSSLSFHTIISISNSNHAKCYYPKFCGCSLHSVTQIPLQGENWWLRLGIDLNYSETDEGDVITEGLPWEEWAHAALHGFKVALFVIQPQQTRRIKDISMRGNCYILACFQFLNSLKDTFSVSRNDTFNLPIWTNFTEDSFLSSQARMHDYITFNFFFLQKPAWCNILLLLWMA